METTWVIREALIIACLGEGVEMKDREFLKEVEQGIFKEPFMVERTPHAGVTLSYDVDYTEEYIIHVNGKSEDYYIAQLPLQKK